MVIGDVISYPSATRYSMARSRFYLDRLKSTSNVHFPIEMKYQWDNKKATGNLRKHGIDFADAVSIFKDDLAITIFDERFEEERYVTIGIDALGRVLVVVYTVRGDQIRLISARKATRKEQQQYQEG